LLPPGSAATTTQPGHGPAPPEPPAPDELLLDPPAPDELAVVLVLLLPLLEAVLLLELAELLLDVPPDPPDPPPEEHAASAASETKIPWITNRFIDSPGAPRGSPLHWPTRPGPPDRASAGWLPSRS
jgi:hypothetical protein